MPALSVNLYKLLGRRVTMGLADHCILSGTITDACRVGITVRQATFGDGPELTTVYVKPAAILWVHTDNVKDGKSEQTSS